MNFHLILIQIYQSFHILKTWSFTKRYSLPVVHLASIIWVILYHKDIVPLHSPYEVVSSDINPIKCIIYLSSFIFLFKYTQHLCFTTIYWDSIRCLTLRFGQKILGFIRDGFWLLIFEIHFIVALSFLDVARLLFNKLLIFGQLL